MGDSSTQTDIHDCGCGSYNVDSGRCECEQYSTWRDDCIADGYGSCYSAPHIHTRDSASA